MPIYEYKCGECGHHLEAIQKMSDEPLKDCPACGRPMLTRLISAAGFQLKGSGWYATDYARSDGKSESSNDSSAKEGTSGSDTDKGAASSSEWAKTTTAEPVKPTQDKSASTNSAA